MRDIVLTCFVLGVLPLAVRHTWIGVLLWTWLSIMNPHKLTWGFAYSAPFAAAAAGATILSIFITKDKVRLEWSPAVITLALFVVWICVTTFFAIDPDGSWEELKRTLKIQLMTFVAIAAIRERRHINWFVCVNVLSLGFYALKGGLFTLLNDGTLRVWGPPDSFIEGNNEIGLALVMVIPLINYLRMVSQHKWVRRGLLVLMVLAAVTVLGTQSRGAFLAIIAMAVVLWWRSEHKAVSAVLIGVVGIALTSFMPETWEKRMDSIGSYDQDDSALGRINAWWMAVHIADDRPLGGGFRIYNPEIFEKYAPVPDDVHAAHSIYFQVLGEHGYVGLTLFVLIGVFTFLTARRIRIESKNRPGSQWLFHLAGMAQVSMVGYAVGGAFLSLAYFDLPYNILVMLVAGLRCLREPTPGKREADAIGDMVHAIPTGQAPQRIPVAKNG